MKLIGSLLFCFITTFSGKSTNPQPGVIRAKLIYKSCASVVIQIEDSSYYYLGQSKWRRTSSQPEYKNVFMVRNSCEFLKQDIIQGQIFYFRKINDQSGNIGCTQCLTNDNTPYARLSIQVTEIAPRNFF
ncbi:hypothetical protein ACI6Q2_02660 [Chitinophagaceae bacterium LWZ2-11]